jgi:pimeloyl-ACP methyl ester carboxylesterase
VLLVHGAGGGFDQGLSLGAPLVQAGFTVIAPSRFGYLRTPAPADASPAAQADAHACLLDALGIDRVVAFGASAGAPSAAELCIRHAARCRAMVLVVPALFAPTGEDPEPPPRVQRIIQGALSSEFMFWLASEVTPRLLIATVLGTPPEDLRAATPADQAQVLRTLRNVAPIGPRAAGLQLDGTVTTAPAAHDFARIDVPSLLVSTDDDGYNTLPAARHAAARIPHAQLVAFAGGGHLLVGHQDELWSAILRFLARIPDPQQPD